MSRKPSASSTPLHTGARPRHTTSRRWRCCPVQQDEERVTARLRGADGAESTLTARWIVGCDGTKSAVRAGAGISFDGETYPELARLLRLREPGSGAAVAGANEDVKLAGMTCNRQMRCLLCVLQASARNEVGVKHLAQEKGRSKASGACMGVVCGSWKGAAAQSLPSPSSS